MDPRQLFLDRRLLELCVYCGVTDTTTRDHVPSKVLLDEPYPSALPVVGACRSCNHRVSADEQYLACFLEAVVSGTADPASMKREKIRRVLSGNPALAARIAASRRTDDAGNLVWSVDKARVRTVLLKLARGHAAFHVGELQHKEATRAAFVPFATMSDDQVRDFESHPVGTLLPEIGSRDFMSMLVAGEKVVTGEGAWHEVQESRYRYAVSYSDGICIRMVLRDYLACEVTWWPTDAPRCLATR